MTNHTIQHQVDQGLFYVSLHDGQRAYLKYRLSNLDATSKEVDFYSTFVPDAHRGQGLAGLLVDHGFKWADAQSLEIKASCWYAAKSLAKRNSTI